MKRGLQCTYLSVGTAGSLDPGTLDSSPHHAFAEKRTSPQKEFVVVATPVLAGSEPTKAV